jgi:hypothetical protein
MNGTLEVNGKTDCCTWLAVSHSRQLDMVKKTVLNYNWPRTFGFRLEVVWFVSSLWLYWRLVSGFCLTFEVSCDLKIARDPFFIHPSQLVLHNNFSFHTAWSLQLILYTPSLHNVQSHCDSDIFVSSAMYTVCVSLLKLHVWDFRTGTSKRPVDMIIKHPSQRQLCSSCGEVKKH